jgi:ATP-dependent DNA helicase RecG
LRLLHAPPPEISMQALRQGGHPAQQRLAFEELVAHRLSLRRRRDAMLALAAPSLIGETPLEHQLTASLPFSLTAAQRRVVAELNSDLCCAHPMQRLVQGDVGSGKTVVAALAMARAIGHGWQAAVMAPTELLASQHWRNLEALFSPLAIGCCWLAGKQRVAERRRALAAIADGSAQMVVGTHALFQEAVNFHRLALVVIDEQHRFGVHQRLALWQKGEVAGLHPHQLIMTATPIPRTLAMTAWADLDLSVIDEVPPGRTPVETVVVAESRRQAVIERIRVACGERRQAYWVCTLIDESEQLEAQAAETTAAALAEQLAPLRVGLVHGRLKGEEKAQVMAAFKGGEIDLLVATTVIEVGVDVPNASLMIIENAERLGLAQLHQLRGRVGRGSARSVCLLLYHPPLSEIARQRLETMRTTHDGFVIAQRDLALRGAGELLGTRQTGEAGWRIADIERDAALLPQVAEVADLLRAEQDCAIEGLIRRWLGGRERYAQA